MTVDYNRYFEFVDGVTSEESRKFTPFITRLCEINDDVDIQRLLTGAIGISAEGGELMEVVKKLIFQGKPINEESLFHIKRELGDVLWYVAQVCMSLNVTLDEVIEENVRKLEKRYPGGSFDVHRSEVRELGDV
jgi:NTP pyrophosphatase (non-canonical NTP hydrolase)